MNAKQKNIHNCLFNKGFLPANKESHTDIRNFNADNMLFEMTACLIVTWSSELTVLYKHLNGFLCIANFYTDGDFSFYVIRPIEEHDLQSIVDTLYEISLEAGLEVLPIWNIEERFLEDYRCLIGYDMESTYNINFSEYVYNTENFINLNGRKNKEKRYLIKKFLDKENVSMQTITKNNINLCLDIENQWCNIQNCDLCKSFAGCSKNTLKIMLDIFDNSIYQGILGFIDDIPVSYIIFEKTSKEMAYFHIAKTIVPDFSVFIYYTAAKQYLYDVKNINTGADLGKDGLRFFKKRLGEYELQTKYLCSFTRRIK